MANLLSAALIALFLASDPLPTSWLSVAGDIFWMISADWSRQSSSLSGWERVIPTARESPCY